MVRTYAYNASSRSEDLKKYRHTAPTQLFDDSSSSTEKSIRKTDYTQNRPDSRKSNSDLTRSASIYNQTNVNQANYFSDNNRENIYHTAFHSAMVDPIGSIVGLRLLYIDGQLVYVPVEPHVNFLINRHFGGPANIPIATHHVNHEPTIFPPISLNNYKIETERSQAHHNRHNIDINANEKSVKEQNQQNYGTNEVYKNEPSSLYRKQYGSLPNLAQKAQLSPQEQHKLELQQQIEENKRRKELEKQKEIEAEEREIRKWEEYRAKLIAEEEKEKNEARDRARAQERRSQQVYEQQQREAEARKLEKRMENKPVRHNVTRQNNSYDEEPIKSTNNNFRRQSSTELPTRRMSQRHQQDPVPVERPDSSQPRDIEWWEKKPTWQERQIERQSAVIPTLRGKPPAVPDSQRSGYDPSASVAEHQSRPESRVTSVPNSRGSIEQNDNDRESPAPRRQSSRPKAPTAFTISA